MDRTVFGAAAAAIAAQTYLSPIKEPSTEKVLLSYLGGNLVLLYCLQLYNNHIGENFLRFTILNLTFLTTAIVLTLLRRLYFSPLSRIPGPPVAALSKLWVSNEYRHGRAARTFRALHKYYNSDIVRIGPNEVILTNADAVEKLYKGKYGRGSSLEIGRVVGTDSLVTQRDYAIHRVWRSAWYVIVLRQ
ncbi:hypothetical protein BGZ60DRAFT_383197 [Tricladium varicosporioides]|nr:hypothetical protein BGZ60DRAFT_383197 [Hymenoscyphus varicosporioides]